MRFISPRAHTIIGTVIGIALLIAPNLFGFADVGGAAVLVPRILGVIVLLSELMVRGSYTGVGVVPMNVHVVTDVIMGGFLAISPWLFHFNNLKTNAWLPHVIVGLAMIAYALATRQGDEVAADDTRSSFVRH